MGSREPHTVRLVPAMTLPCRDGKIDEDPEEKNPATPLVQKKSQRPVNHDFGGVVRAGIDAEPSPGGQSIRRPGGTRT
jgi:hypothetical protein